jgi:hypothetical protein
MNKDIGKVVGHGIELGEVVINSQRQHAQRMIVVLSDILRKDDLEVMRRKRTDILVISDIVIVVPVGKLIVKCILETDKRNDTDSSDDQCIFICRNTIHKGTKI